MSLFVQNLKNLRKKFNVSQEQLPFLINAKKSSIVNIENKGAEPSIDLLISLANFFNVSVDELVGNETHQHKEPLIQSQSNKISYFDTSKTLKEITSLNFNSPQWIRYKEKMSVTQQNDTYYNTGALELYNPLDYSEENERIYLDFVNCTSGDLFSNYSDFFNKYGYIGKIKSSYPLPGGYDINMLKTVFAVTDKIQVHYSESRIPALFDSHGLCYLTRLSPEREDYALKEVSEQLSNFQFTHTSRQLRVEKGYFETFEWYSAYVNELKYAIFAFQNGNMDGFYKYLNRQMNDIIIQTEYINEQAQNTFVYNSLFSLMCMELCHDLQSGYSPVLCACGNFVLVRDTEFIVCPKCNSRRVYKEPHLI